ncbi:hypothetical protein [Streptomyces wuyuanensis]|uniref:hypothetical protein n=1 Tax=Streptomyces wuyuanensis TaxID=1196353 RepID=UPI000B824B81|nr:hypothetical protein [Streptomyces wuyuanensis]
MSELLTALPVVPEPAARPLLVGLELTERPKVPAWITDPAVRASAEAGLYEIPDEFFGDGR